ncbi:MAG: GspH/FimT family pseudopilin [Agarilytica sp.]
MKRITGSAGYTLVELILTVTIAAILLAIATPNFRDYLLQRKISSELRNLKLDLAQARSDAITRNTYVGICSSDDAAGCMGGADWSEGWILFEDNGEGAGTPRDGVRNGSETIIKVHQAGDIDVSITAFDVNSSNVNGLAYNSRGYLGLVERGSDLSPERLSFRFCVEGDEVFARGAIVALTGRVADASDSDADGIYEDVSSANFDCPS